MNLAFSSFHLMETTCFTEILTYSCRELPEQRGNPKYFTLNHPRLTLYLTKSWRFCDSRYKITMTPGLFFICSMFWNIYIWHLLIVNSAQFNLSIKLWFVNYSFKLLLNLVSSVVMWNIASFHLDSFHEILVLLLSSLLLSKPQLNFTLIHQVPVSYLREVFSSRIIWEAEMTNMQVFPTFKKFT